MTQKKKIKINLNFQKTFWWEKPFLWLYRTHFAEGNNSILEFKIVRGKMYITNFRKFEKKLVEVK